MIRKNVSYGSLARDCESALLEGVDPRELLLKLSSAMQAEIRDGDPRRVARALSVFNRLSRRLLLASIPAMSGWNCS